LLRWRFRWRFRKAELVCECGGFIAHLLGKLALITLDERPVLSGDDRYLRGRYSAGGIQVLLDLLMGCVVRISDVALGESNVLTEPALGGGHTVEHIDDRHMRIVFR
jgi:hypothetical protein